MFKILLGFTALLIAGCAAFFSVRGIATLFSGAFLAVIIMAGSLELGKLVATTFLHRYWSKTSALLKTYLLIAVFALMGITSLGTYGFLSAAFQTNAAALNTVTEKIALIEQQKGSLNDQVEQLQERITTLNESRKQQEKNLSTVTSNATTKYKLVYEDVQRSGTEINKVQEKIEALQQQISVKDEDLTTLKLETTKAGDIGAFQFIAENFDMPLNTIVKWFIILIVIVFDPLAIALVLAFNTLLENRKKEDQEYIDSIVNRPVVTTVVQEPQQEVQEAAPSKFFTVGDTLKFTGKQ